MRVSRARYECNSDLLPLKSQRMPRSIVSALQHPAERADMMADIGKLRFAQKDGGLPTILAAGSAPGESGVSVFRSRFEGGAHYWGTTRQHLVCFTSRVRINCRMASRTFFHEVPTGALAICPAGTEGAADTAASIDSIIVAIDPCRFALAAAESSALEAQLIERLAGYDHVLLDLAGKLAMESADNYPNGSLFWNELASTFIAHLLAQHSSKAVLRPRGMLGEAVLARLRDYVMAHLDQPIEVAALAKIAARSPYHFTRIFTRSVGVSPHRYVVHLRLQRALELLREGRSGLADIAAHTGFADQSHLSRWVRRVHGASLTQLAA
jgi:AraC family transcriptional regulator